MSGSLIATTNPQPAVARLVALVEELLDAHGDTVGVASTDSDEVTWAAHVDYLKALQRLGQQTLAQTASGSL